jgi:ankyrin repeat protein
MPPPPPPGAPSWGANEDNEDTGLEVNIPEPEPLSLEPAAEQPPTPSKQRPNTAGKQRPNTAGKQRSRRELTAGASSGVDGATPSPSMSSAWTDLAEQFVDDMETKGDPALRDAAATGDEAELAMCLWRSETGLRIDAPYEYGCTALWLAAANGHHGCVMLLAEGRADVSAAASNGATPVSIAAQNGYTNVLQLLYQCGSDIDAPGACGATAAYQACAEGQAAVLRTLDQLDADLNIGVGPSRPVHAACFAGHTEVVRQLIASGAELDVENTSGASPFFLACERGHVDIVRVLAEADADMEKADNSLSTPLFTAAEHGQTKVVRLLLSLGVQLDTAGQAGLTALHAACHLENKEVASLLCKCDRAKTSKPWATVADGGLTPLHIACCNNRADIVDLLIGHGADPKACTDDGLSARDLALAMGSTAVVTALDKAAAAALAGSKNGGDGSSGCFGRKKKRTQVHPTAVQ